MLALLKRKKLKEDKASNIFVNSLLQLVEDGFPEVAALINEAPEFVTSPNISPQDSDRFLLTVIAGNIKFLPGHFSSFQEIRLMELINRKFSRTLGLDTDIFRASISKHQNYFKRINHPSKNTTLAMSKAIFFKYDLVKYQEEFFVKMESPNPIFLKRLNEVMASFVWDWEAFMAKYRIVE